MKNAKIISIPENKRDENLVKIDAEKWARITDLIRCLKKVFIEATSPGEESIDYVLIGEFLWELLENEIAEQEN